MLLPSPKGKRDHRGIRCQAAGCNTKPRPSDTPAWAGVPKCRLSTEEWIVTSVQRLRERYLAPVFVGVENFGRGRHQPSTAGWRPGSLRDSDRKAIRCHRLRLGLGVQIDVPTLKPTPERAE